MTSDKSAKDCQRRAGHRLPVECRVFIEVVAPQAGDDEGEIAVCRTLDVSSQGLQVAVDRQLTEQAILQIGIDPPVTHEVFYLTGEVRWCRENDDDNLPYRAGFALFNAQGSDIDQWCALIGAMGEEEPEG